MEGGRPYCAGGIRAAIMMLLVGALAHAESQQNSYQFVTVRNFVIDGPKLAAQHAKVTLTGSYILQGNAGVLYTDSQAVVMATYSPDAGRQPSVGLLTEDASHKLREILLSCDSNPSSAQLGCQITIRGHATTCIVNNVFGATHQAPCVDVEDGDHWLPPTPAPEDRSGTKPAVLRSTPIKSAASPAAASVADEAATPPTLPPSAIDDLTSVRSVDAQAADHIANYCSQSAQGDAQREARCRGQELHAWQRLVPGHEFPNITQAIIDKCRQPPFPDTYVAHEACAKYELSGGSHR